MLILVEKDTEPTILQYAVEGVPVDITGYAFTLHIGYSQPLSKAAQIHDAAKGLIRIPWDPTDLKPGDYDGEIVVTAPGNTERTLKTEKIRILKRLA